MGKHNGKARKLGLPVGSALVNRAKREGRSGTAAAYLHTTDSKASNTMQSVLESNDLQEMMSLAELAGRNFAGEKEHTVVISMGAVSAKDQERAAVERAETEARNAHRLRIPRRPAWSPSTTAEQLDEAERSSFLQWRRDLANLESDERLVLTPFEKNLEVWRQLWRVVERSDSIVQVVDARDPLTYRCEDLEAYCYESHPTKHSLLLLNKSDLLPEELRSAWADYFDAKGVRYAFWSARAAAEAEDEDNAAAAAAKANECKDPRARLLDVSGLLELLEAEAQRAMDQAEEKGIPRAARGERLVVGLIGYPNVGKSSTINALFGSKKTAVAATPGKTKHFQTLNVSDTLCLCDCPGLVMPRFARSKAEMVAAGVVPIDRLTDIRGPVAAVAQRVSRDQLEKVYGIRLPSPKVNEDPHRAPTAPELLRALASSRGWIGASGLPDETRAGRKMLKDYIDGKILHCTPPPDCSPEIVALVEEISGRKVARSITKHQQQQQQQQRESVSVAGAGGDQGSGSDGSESAAAAAEGEGGEEAGSSGQGTGPSVSAAQLEAELDLELLEAMNLSGKKAKPVRPEYKFQRKPPRTKTRTSNSNGEAYDGAPLQQGKRGGLVRVAGY